MKHPVVENVIHPYSDLLVFGMNSTRGAIEEAVEHLKKEGWKADHIRPSIPFRQNREEKATVGLEAAIFFWNFSGRKGPPEFRI